MERRNQKPERKIIEKNRRNQLKFLSSQLFSLLPNDQLTPKRGALMPERVDEAVEYIKSLKTKVETSKEKKEKLLMRKKRSHEYIATESNSTSSCKPVNIEIHEMGPGVDIVLITGIPNHSNFCDTIRVLDEFSEEVVHASFSTSGSSTFHIQHKKIGAAEMYKRLKELLEGSSNNQESTHGSSSSEDYKVDSSLELWDFAIQPDIWDLVIPQVLPMRI